MDVAGGKQTLPVLLAMDAASADDRAHLEKWVAEDENLDRIIDTVRKYNGLNRALDVARKYADQAAEALASLKATDPIAIGHLTALPAYVIGRTY